MIVCAMPSRLNLSNAQNSTQSNFRFAASSNRAANRFRFSAPFRPLSQSTYSPLTAWPEFTTQARSSCSCRLRPSQSVASCGRHRSAAACRLLALRDVRSSDDCRWLSEPSRHPTTSILDRLCSEWTHHVILRPSIAALQKERVEPPPVRRIDGACKRMVARHQRRGRDWLVDVAAAIGACLPCDRQLYPTCGQAG